LSDKNKGKKTINVELETWQALSKIKVDLGLKNFDEVIRTIIAKSKTYERYLKMKVLEHEHPC